ncbi:hypothetical protein QL285_065382 [Trifolium repens]|nr:hypothetical protein QL285_065382 [Trifolium repens]
MNLVDFPDSSGRFIWCSFSRWRLNLPGLRLRRCNESGQIASDMYGVYAEPVDLEGYVFLVPLDWFVWCEFCPTNETAEVDVKFDDVADILPGKERKCSIKSMKFVKDLIVTPPTTRGKAEVGSDVPA